MQSKTTKKFFEDGYPSFYYSRPEKKIVEVPVYASSEVTAGARTIAEPTVVGTPIPLEKKAMDIKLNDRQKALLLSGGRWLLSAVVAGLAAWVAGPDGLELLGTQGQAIAVLVVGTLVQSVNRDRRFGEKPHEDEDEKLLTLNKG